ncbi:hypothetical protein LPJ55_004746 [Coemansia sp. RSA 990]|nr:hypothetical protein LPJ55_004746 [Coemansia sp. RSA 990]KAJ2650667.1 hypothetical protein IWW40_002175 [Coemansia sp. RSA 1250]
MDKAEIQKGETPEGSEGRKSAQSWLSGSSGASEMAHPPIASPQASGPQNGSFHIQQPACSCKCSQCDPNFYTIPMHLLFAGKVEYVCRDCQFSTLSYAIVQQHEVSSGHRRWYNFPQ